jgi:hypothetical protein
VGGECHDEDEGLPCVNDDNTICADKSCFCVSGTHVRAGKCFKGKLGSIKMTDIILHVPVKYM